MNEDRVTISGFFAAAERRMFSLARDFAELPVRICGKLIRMHFQTERQAARAAVSLTGLVAEMAGDGTGADFYYWTDDIGAYLPEGSAGQKGVWTSRDETGYLHIISEYGMMGADYTRNRYYMCLRDEDNGLDSLNSHAMIVSLFRWALREDMMVMHAAAVGDSGSGILIGGRGGMGKSTLSVACLLNGMDFTADDYVLLNRDGPLTAMPLYRTVGLNPDMENVLKPGLPVLKRDESRGGKLLLDASGLRFCEALPVKGILLPRIGGGAEAGIAQVHPGSAIVQMVHSSLTQFDVFRETGITRMMLGRLSGLPVYEMLLSEDPDKNVKALRRFLRGQGGPQEIRDF